MIVFTAADSKHYRVDLVLGFVLVLTAMVTAIELLGKVVIPSEWKIMNSKRVFRY